MRAQTASPARLPNTPVAVARCNSFDEDLTAILRRMGDQIGGLAPIVRNKTVTIKLNLTGSPGLRFLGKPLGVTHYTHPKTAAVLATVLAEAGATRIRFVESCWGTGGPMEEYMLESGWNVRQLQRVAPKVEFVNTNSLAGAKRYARFKVPGQPLMYPAYDLHPAYEETDVLVSMAKLKEHETTGITLAMKNIFGCTPASIYGDDAGIDEPNEAPTSGRGAVCHAGQRQPAKSAPGEIDPASPRVPYYRMPRIVAELNGALPIGLSFIDGIETIRGGEGPWIGGIEIVKPGLLILGTNAINTDAVGAALMGHDPRAPKGAGAFKKCENYFLLAEQLGLGSANAEEIDVRGVSIREGRFPFATGA
ncbi:MAG: DUF362 domain-containing protein [Bryobacterales bacterium]|nr:DUF362 domain-containing protein [Bryobacterales bacterium]